MTAKQFLTGAAALALIIALTGCAQAPREQEDTDAVISAGADVEFIKLDNWSYDKLYELGGMRADRLMKSSVYSTGGEEIGSVANIIIGENNRAVALIAQVGGLWGIGDTPIAVPWEDVEVAGDRITVPVTEDNVERYRLFDNKHITGRNLRQTVKVEEDVETGPRTWKLTSLLNDYATLNGGVGYGYVNDVVLSKDGVIQAVIIESATRYGIGPYAYPFYGYDQQWNPAFETFELPYNETDVRGLEPFDAERLDKRQ